MIDANHQNRSRLAPLIRRANGLWQSLAIAAVFAVMGLLEVLAPLDGGLYDFFVQHSPESRHVAPRQVVLVDTPVSAFFDPETDWNRAVEDLVGMGARLVVFTVVPEGSRAATARLLQHPRVVLGSDLAPDPDDPSMERFNLGPEVARLPVPAASEIPEPLLGVHRYQRYAFRVGEQAAPGLEALAARRLGIDVPAAGRYLVNFSNASRPFPRLRLQQLVQGKVVDAVVRDRVVLIGIGTERFHRAVVTPITDNGREVPKLDFHGYALDSLLSGTGIASLPSSMKAVLVLSTWLLAFILLQPLGFRTSFVFATVAIAALAGMAWVALVGARVHVPVVGPMLVVGATLVAVLQSKSERHDRALVHLVNEANVAAAGRLRGQVLALDQGFWDDLLHMLDQVVPFSRALLLNRVDGTPLLREVRGLRCTHDPVATRRLLDEPFRSAATQRAVVDGPDLIRPAVPGERQYLAVLASDGEPMGFLAFALSADQGAQLPTIHRALDALSGRVADLMRAQRDQASAVRDDRRHSYVDDPRFDRINRLALHFRHSERHAEIMEDVLDRLDTPTVVYNLFGRYLFANAAMKALLKEAMQATDGSLSATQLMEQACGLTADGARLALAGAMFDASAFEAPAWIGAARYTLKATALRPLVDSGAADQLHGVMLQLLLLRSAGQATAARMTPSRELTGPGGEAAATDLWLPLESAVKQVSQLEDFESLQFELEGSREPAIVAAPPESVEALLASILQLFAYDSRLPGTVTVQVHRSARQVTLSMRNEGYGMPDERLQAMLHGPTWPQSAALRRIRLVRDELHRNEGQVTLSSGVGQGYCAEVALPLAG